MGAPRDTSQGTLEPVNLTIEEGRLKKDKDCGGDGESVGGDGESVEGMDGICGGMSESVGGWVSLWRS